MSSSEGNAKLWRLKRRTIDPDALEIPAPQGRIYTNGERCFSISA